jgi:hypothetical protein
MTKRTMLHIVSAMFKRSYQVIFISTVDICPFTASDKRANNGAKAMNISKSRQSYCVKNIVSRNGCFAKQYYSITASPNKWEPQTTIYRERKLVKHCVFWRK